MKKVQISIYVCRKQLMLLAGLIKSNKQVLNSSFVQNLRSEMNLEEISLASSFLRFV